MATLIGNIAGPQGPQGEPGPTSVAADHGVGGTGTSADPVVVRTAADWADLAADLEVVAGQTQDGGMPLYLDSAGDLRTPAGLYVAPRIGGFETVPTTSRAWNKASLLLGDRSSTDVRVLAHGRAQSNGRSSLVRWHASQTSNRASARVSVEEYPDATATTADEIAVLLVTVNGQMSVQNNVTGATVTRPVPFAQATGFVTFDPVPAGTSAQILLTLPANRFTVAPFGLATVVSASPHARNASTDVPTLTAMRVYYGNWGTATEQNPRAHWHAIQLEAAPAALAASLMGRSAPVAAAGPYGPGDPLMPAMATCHTEGCENAGIPIELDIGYEDADGDVVASPVSCGVCGRPITDVVELS